MNDFCLSVLVIIICYPRTSHCGVPLILFSLVSPNWQRLQAYETGGVLAKDDGISIYTDLVHVGADVVCVVTFAEGVRGQA